jgi:hypothetical protein
MKTVLSLALTTTFLSSSPILAMDEKIYEKDLNLSKTSCSYVSVDKEKQVFLQYLEHVKSEKDFYEDRHIYLEAVQKEYKEDLITKGKVNALKIISQKLGITETKSNYNINSFLSLSIKDCEVKYKYYFQQTNNLKEILEKNGKSIEKVKIVFSDLWNYHTKNLESRLNSYLKRKRESELHEIYVIKKQPSHIPEKGDYHLLEAMKNKNVTQWLPPTCQSYLEVETFQVNKGLSRTATESYQDRLYFLKKLYKLLKTRLPDEQLASIQLNRNLYDVLEEKVKDLGHPDQALETLPTPEDIEKAITYWKKNKKKPLLAYYQRPSRLEEKEIIFVKDNERKPMISWDLVTLKNIDDILPQVKHFFPNLNEKSKTSICEFQEKKRQRLRLELKKECEILKYEIIKIDEPKTHPIIFVSNNESPSLHNIFQISKGKISPFVVTETTIPSAKTPKKEKNHEERKQEYEYKLAKEQKRQEQQNQSKEIENSKGEENNNNSNISSPQLSEGTLKALSKIFKFTPVKHMLWLDFVNAWKELRKVIDGVEDKSVNVGGSIRRFHGGPLQQGKKQQPKSFNLHEPHRIDGDTIGPRTMARIAEHFQIKFDWTLEKLKKHGLEKGK